MARKMKIFAWDFHGTLEEGVEVGFWHILKQLAREWKIKEDFKLAEVRKLYGISVTDYLKHFFPKLSDSEILKMRARVADIQNPPGHLGKFVKAAPGAKEVLSKIKKAGHKNFIVSNSHPEHIKLVIGIVGLSSFFEEIYAIDRHYSAEKINALEQKIKIMKGVVAKNKLGRGEFISIGDRATDVNAGLAVGAITYQYLRRGFPVDETNADYKIYDLREVLREI